MENKRTRISALLLVLALMLSVFGITAYAQEETAAEAAVCYVPGDMNCDGHLDSRDAIYTLYASVGNGNYPVTQDSDFDGDGDVDKSDAIWLLYASLGMRNHQLEGEYHTYHEPIWTWEDDYSAAQLVLACGCGNQTEPTAAAVASEEKAATCTELGAVTYTASAEIDGQTYTDVKVVYGDAVAGHEIGQPTCSEAAKCANCDFEIAATGHSYVKSEEECVAATCKEAAKEVWNCSVCGDRLEKTVGVPVNHKYVLSGEEYEISNGNCQYVREQAYVCEYGCGTVKTERSDSYTSHTYEGVTTQAPTCISAGVTTYTCSGCGHSYTEEIAVSSEHAWVYGDTTAVCADCGTEKTVVKMGSEGLTAEQITTNEIVLENNASVTLDDATLATIEEGQTLVLEVNEVDAPATVEMEVAKAYDLNMYVDGEQVSNFEDKVTVSLPYTLQEGDDVNAIAVYYYNDETGELDIMYGTYAGGYVTFETDHFSFYFICILTMENYCEAFGHFDEAIDVEPTCEQAGYRIIYCNICGRSEVFYDETMAPKGHRYDEVSIEGHCTEDISYTQYCLECGAANELYFPALGHNMVESERIDATCTESGKIVYICDRICNDPADPMMNGNCEHTYEEAIAQLSHEYEATELTQTCTTGGGTQYVCKHCGDSYIENPTNPAGHAYTLIDWTWDGVKNVTVSLGCANCDWAYSQSAVITKKVTAPSCGQAGVITYTATFVYNMIPFTESVEVPIEALEHTSNGSWQHNANQHYQSCILCGETIHAANHEWSDLTVTKEPTCVEAGSGTQSCSICGYEKTVTIAATGEHSYVNGKCSVCGFEEGSCNHVRTYETQIDLAELGGCGGTIYVYSCECGYQFQAGYEVDCDLRHSDPEYVEDQYGFGCYYYTSHCEDCGFTFRYCEYSTEFDPDTCTGWNLMDYDISIGDVELKGQWHDSITQFMSGRIHPTVATGNTVDLRPYGLCGEILYEYACPCGEQVTYYIEGRDTSCDWSYSSELSTDDMNVYICDSCGAEKHTAWEEIPSDDSCLWVQETTFTYFVNGEQVYEYTNTSYIINHSYNRDRCEMLGESCTDGMYLYLSCEGCGQVKETYAEYHVATIDPEYIELSGICTDVAYQGTCPCGEFLAFGYGDETWCEFWHTDYNEETETRTYTCQTCGAVKTETRELVSQGENCMNLYLTTVKLYDAEGNLLVTGYQHGEWEEHTFVNSGELKGESCDDGVKITCTCADCGYSYSYTSYGHESVYHEEYDVSAFDMCTDAVYVYTCACGEDTGISGIWSCDWNWIDGEELESGYVRKYQCSQCLTFRTLTVTYGEGINACQNKCTYTYTFEKDGVEPLAVSYETIENNHTYIYEMGLMEGSTSCEDGFWAIGTCQVCGHVEEERGSGGHPRYDISREVVTENLTEEQKLCGDLLLVTRSCPCGAYTDQNTEWLNEACTWEESYWNSELDAHVEVCSECGVHWAQIDSFQADENNPCIGTVTCENIFFRGEEEVLRFSESWRSWNHLEYCTFEMLGETCDDGYRVYWHCARCGEDTGSGMNYGCDRNHTTNIQYIDNENICGSLYFRTYGCPCTPEKGSWYNWDCDFDYLGWDNTLGGEIWQCVDCGLNRIATYGMEESIEGQPCITRMPVRYVFMLNGETLGDFSIYESWDNHQYTYSFDMMGDSCDDGYRQSAQCVNCDHGWTDEDLRYDHDRFIVDYYDLSDYGMCGGEIEHRKCPCGQEETWYMWDNCNWYDTGETDPDTGACYRYCKDCGSSFIVASSGTTDETCRYNGTYYIKIYNGEEEKLNIAGNESYENHNTYVSDYTMMYPEGSCEDGVMITHACYNCDYSRTEECYWHYQVINEYTSLSEALGACGGYLRTETCACGQNLYSYCNDYSCNWYWMDGWTETIDGVEHQFSQYYCYNCGLVRLKDRVEVYTEGSCYYDVYEIRTYTMEGYDPITFEESWTSENHQYEETAVLNDGSETCADGVTIYRTCTVCSYSESYETDYCDAVLVNTIDFSQYTECGGYGYQYSCACGRYVHYNWENYCNWNWVEDYLYTDPNGNEHSCSTYKCTDCGMSYRYEGWTQPIEGTCYKQRISQYIFTMGEDTFGSLSYCSTYESHDYEYTVNMLGESCEDGIYVIEKCRNCDYTDEYNTTNHIYTNNVYLDFGELGLCEGYAEGSSCPCGLYSSSYYDVSCSWGYATEETVIDDDGNSHQVITYICDNCGMKRIRDNWSDPVEGTCSIMEYDYFSYYLNDELLITTARCYLDYSHTEQYSFELKGKTCADGVRVYTSCIYCDYGYYTNITSCRNYLAGTYELPEGSCGGTVTVYSCPCGNSGYLSQNYDCSFNTYLEGEYNGDNGYSAYSCDTCGTVRHYAWYDEDIGNCQTRRTYTYTYSHKEQDDVAVSYANTSTNHTRAYTTQLLEGSETCEDGILISYACSVCGGDSGSYESSYHATYNIGTEIQFPEGSCGGRSYEFVCACGAETAWDSNYDCSFSFVANNSVTDDNGIEHRIYEYACDCGMRYIYYNYSIPAEEACTYEEYTTYTYYFGEEELGSISNSSTYTSHDTECFYELITPGTSCTDGITCTYRCTNCGTVTSSYTAYSHYTKWEYINIPTSCGGYIEYYSCACGESSGVYDYAGCTFQHVDGEDYSEYIGGNWWYFENYVCSCGMTLVRGTGSEYAGNCVQLDHTKCSYYYKGEFLGEYQTTTSYTSHRNVFSSRLLDGSVTCSDGIEVTTTCECGETAPTTQVQYYCPTIYSPGCNLVETQTLSTPGSCGPVVVNLYECPCGLMSYVDFVSSPYDNCNMETVEMGNAGIENCMMHYKDACTDCGLTYSYTILNEWTDRCYCDEIVDIEIGYNGSIVASYHQLYSRAYVHENSEFEYVMHGTSCTDGVDVTQICQDCGKVESWPTEDHVYAIEGEQLVLPEDSCGGCFTVMICLCETDPVANVYNGIKCAMNWNNWWSETIDGIEHNYDEYICSECGFRYVCETYWAADGDTVSYVTVYHVYNGDTLIGTISSVV